MMTSSSKRAGCALLLSLALMVPARSVAAATPEEMAQARVLFREGKKLRAEEQLDAAIEKLRAAHALARTAVTGAELAATLARAGKLVEARSVARAAADMPREADETQASDRARAEADALAKRLDVTLAEGEQVTLAEGEQKDVAVELRPEPVAPPAVAPPHPAGAPLGPPAVPPDGTNGASSRGSSPLVVGGFGVAAAAAATGAVTGVLAFTSLDAARQHCQGTMCTPDASEHLDRSQTMGNVATVAFIVAGAGVVVGVVGLLLAKKTPASASGGAYHVQF